MPDFALFQLCVKEMISILHKFKLFTNLFVLVVSVESFSRIDKVPIVCVFLLTIQLRELVVFCCWLRTQMHLTIHPYVFIYCSEFPEYFCLLPLIGWSYLQLCFQPPQESLSTLTVSGKTISFCMIRVAWFIGREILVSETATHPLSAPSIFYSNGGLSRFLIHSECLCLQDRVLCFFILSFDGIYICLSS